MTRIRFAGLLVLGLLLVTLALPAPVLAAQEGLDALLGSWQVQMSQRGRTVSSVLTFTRAVDGTLAGTWKGPRGQTDLQDVKFKDGKLSFKRAFNTPRGEFRIDYEVWIQDGKLAGKMKTPRGTRDFTGTRADA